MATESNKDTRNLILEAAYKLFGNYGFDGTSMKAIANEAGIVPGSIYNYFSDKEELFTSAVITGWEYFITESQKIWESHASIKEKLKTLIDMGFGLLKNAQPLLKGMFFGANQRKLVQENLERLLDSWEMILVTDQKQKASDVFISPEKRRALTKYILMGILLAVAMATQEELDPELEKIKQEIMLFIYDKE